MLLRNIVITMLLTSGLAIGQHGGGHAGSGHSSGGGHSSHSGHTHGSGGHSHGFHGSHIGSSHFHAHSSPSGASHHHYGSHNSNYAYGVARDAEGRIARSSRAREEFMRGTGYPHGRPGWVIDHIIPLKRGGSDSPSNMQWQTKEEAKAKDKWE
jgi:hypothetical protein